MADRRRKWTITGSYSGDTVKDFNAVDPVQPRRQSDWGDQEGGHQGQESWMSKVSLAMSNRLFSTGKKSNGSRSTQVLPLIVPLSDNNMHLVERMPSSSLLSSAQDTHQQNLHSDSTTSQPILRHVLSEASLANPTVLSPVTAFECPKKCNAGGNDSDGRYDDDNSESRWSSRGSISRSHTSQQRKIDRPYTPSTSALKVKPRDEQESDEEEVNFASNRTRVTSIPNCPVYSRGARGDNDLDTNVQAAAPILKGFFTRDASVGNELRLQQREQRREALYRESRQRQDKLREQTERERVSNEELGRKLKVEQLRRLNQQRRKNLLRDAASARVHLLDQIEEDKKKYHSQRERWENDFEDEMNVLSAAFRKAHTAEQNRPMTVAGLAVPEAISQLERDASNFEKRVKTAQPALGSVSVNLWRPSTTSNAGDLCSTASFFKACEVLTLEDSKEVLDLFAADNSSNAHDDVVKYHTQQPDLNTQKLLQEREDLLQRLAAIDRLVQGQKQP